MEPEILKLNPNETKYNKKRDIYYYAIYSFPDASQNLKLFDTQGFERFHRQNNFKLFNIFLILQFKLVFYKYVLKYFIG